MSVSNTPHFTHYMICAFVILKYPLVSE